MRIVVFTLDDREFIPSLLDPLLERPGLEIVSVLVSNPPYSWRFLRKRIGFLIRNRYPFCIHLGDWARRIAACLRSRLGRWRGEPKLVDMLRAKGIRAEYLKEIRSESAREQLRALDADVFLFCPFDRIVGSEFLSIPRMGTYNLHLGKLPEYRGGLHSFWVLRFGDTQAGATVHQVTEELDAGDIVAERRFAVRSSSVHELMKETIRTAAKVVVEALDRVEAGNWTPVDTSGRPTAYHMLPTREDFQAFYARGCRLV
ncbi:MAG: hypothetical protein GY842_19265 [bacterium]|nr:hypothetical protein [bacterium]